MVRKPWPLSEAISARFHALIDQRSPSECWLWLGALRGGYGVMCVGYHKKTHRSIYAGAHIMSYALKSGGWPRKRIVIRHRCDNPPCVNPNHLEPGTQSDNTRDAIMRGRQKWFTWADAALTRCR